MSDCPPEFAPGSVLPDDLVRHWLAGCGQGVKIYRGCRIVGADRVRLGDASQIDEGVLIFAGEGVEIGRHVHLAFGTSISGGGWCRVEDFAGIGAGTRIITGTDEADGTGLTNPTVPAAFRRVRRSQVTIGAHALVFTNAVVFPGVTIGEGAVVAAGSWVHHDLKPWGIYAGNPLTQVGTRPPETVLAMARELLSRE